MRSALSRRVAVRSAALWAALLASPSCAARGAETLVDSATYVVSFGGVASGVESVVIRDSARVRVARGASTLRLGDVSMSGTSTLTLDGACRPLHFDSDFRLAGTQTQTHITFDGGTSVARTTRAGATRTDTIACTPSAAYVPSNTIYALALLAQCMRERRIVTHPLYPSGIARLTRRGSRVDRGVAVTQYDLDLAGLLTASLSVDARDRVVRISIPLQNLDITRVGAFAASADTARVPRRIAQLRPIDSVPKGLVGEEVAFLGGAGVTLAGTVLRPDGSVRARYPAVLLLAGSGPQDRNGDTPGDGGVHLGLLRVIAERLGRSGVATLRLDDRGTGASGGAFSPSSLDDYVADARAALAHLRARSDVDPARVGVIGHSEGAAIACLLAAEDTTIAAIGLLAGFAEPFGVVAMQQTSAQLRRAGVPEDLVRRTAAEESAFIDVLRARRAWSPSDAPESMRSLGARKRWLEDMVALDMPGTLARVRSAVGIFQGGRDEQVTSRNARLIDSLLTRAGLARHRVYLFPRLNHLFVESSGGGYAEYTDPRRRVDASFARSLARWAARALGSPRRRGDGT